MPDGLTIVSGLALGAGIGFLHLFFARRAYRLSPDRATEWFSERPLTRSDRTLMRQLAVGGILNENNFFPINAVDPCKSKKEMRAWLLDAWHVYDHYGATTEIEHLLDKGHGEIFDAILALSPQMDSETLRQHLEQRFGGPAAAADIREFVDNHAVCLPTLEAWGYLTSPADLERGTRAYDWGRAVTVARVARGAGYLTEREARGFIARAALLSAQAFDSWREFAVSYLLGRAIWGGIGDPHLKCMHEIAAQLQTHPHSPWVTEGWFAPAMTKRL